jgi:hypothetical protein
MLLGACRQSDGFLYGGAEKAKDAHKDGRKKSLQKLGSPIPLYRYASALTNGLDLTMHRESRPSHPKGTKQECKGASRDGSSAGCTGKLQQIVCYPRD